MIILATFLPAALMSMRYFQERADEIAVASIQLSRAASDMASSLEGRILGTAQLLYGLGRARDLDTHDIGACSAFLLAVRTQYPQYTGILTIAPDGSLSCDSLLSGRSFNFGDRGYFKKASVATDAVTVEAVVGRITGISVLQVAYPVRSETGQLKFVLLASLNLAAFADYHSMRLPRAMTVIILDEKGAVLVGPSQKDRSTPGATATANLLEFAATHANEKAIEVTGVDGHTQVWGIAASQPSPRGAGLFFAVGQSKDDLVADANRNLAHDLTILAVLSLLLFAGVWTLAELGVRRQIRRVSTMAIKLGLGDLTARILPPYPSGELGALMTVLNSTAGSLENQRASIEDLNERLHQAQKMEALGQLTGGIAHDFNNLLTVISGNSEFLIEGLHDNDELRMLAEISLQAAQRASEHTRALLAFARRQPLEPKIIDVNLLISNMEPLLRQTLGQNITMKFVRPPDLWRSLVDPSQLEGALLNLCVNARDAMEDGGRLTIETANTQLDPDAAVTTRATLDDYVMITVSDSGTGISREHLIHVFEPFFTTKAAGKGTGLGLSMVYGFIKQSCGQIKIYSEVGEGTAIKMFLPRSRDGADDLIDEETGSLVDLRGSEKILVVEDDALVRGNVERQLLALGYTVTTAEDGPTALGIIASGHDIDLLFTDVVMPGGMNGRTLALRSLEIRPGLKILYTSGFTEDTVLYKERIEGTVILLNKPYSRIELARKIRAALTMHTEMIS